MSPGAVTTLPTHPGYLCESGARAVRLAIELGHARQRITELEAEVRQLRSEPSCADLSQLGEGHYAEDDE
jgi:hypothetical protein